MLSRLSPVEIRLHQPTTIFSPYPNVTQLLPMSPSQVFTPLTSPPSLQKCQPHSLACHLRYCMFEFPWPACYFGNNLSLEARSMAANIAPQSNKSYHLYIFPPTPHLMLWDFSADSQLLLLRQAPGKEQRTFCLLFGFTKEM